MQNKYFIILCSLLLINALAIQKIDIVHSADNVLTNTNPVEIVVSEKTNNISINDSLKQKLNVTADWENIVVNMSCNNCHVMFYIVNNESMNNIISGISQPYEIGEVYLESVDSISNAPYQVPTKGIWWVVISNSIEKTEIQVNLSIGLQQYQNSSDVSLDGVLCGFVRCEDSSTTFQNPDSVSFDGIFGLFSLIFISLIVISKKTNRFR